MIESFHWNTETILILGIVTFVVFALLGLVIWNNKTNKQVKTLISIDDSLKHLDATEQEAQSSPPETPAEDTPPEAVLEAEPVEIKEEIQEPESRANIGRSGRVYTKEELEVQIR
jgi:Na+/H+ antiporter NhaC